MNNNPKVQINNAKNPLKTIEQQKILESKARLAFLDILRFIAAFIVIIAHLYDSNVAHQGFKIFDLKKDFLIFYNGVAGVIIFFLISGYIIPSAITRCNNIKDFLIKRVIRIYPLLIIVMIYGLIRYGGFKEKMIFGLILPIADFMGGTYLMRGNVDWTMRVEFFYYILIALIYFKNKFNFKTILFCIVATSALIIITYIFHEINIHIKLLYLNFIFLGTLLYLIEKEKFSNFGNNIWTLFAFISSISIFEIFGVYDNYPLPRVLFATAIFLFFYFLHQTKFRVKSNSFVTFLGDLSYPSYLLHLMIYKDLYRLSNSHIVTPIIFVIICYATHLLIEKPSMKKLKKIFSASSGGSISKSKVPS